MFLYVFPTYLNDDSTLCHWLQKHGSWKEIDQNLFDVCEKKKKRDIKREKESNVMILFIYLNVCILLLSF